MNAEKLPRTFVVNKTKNLPVLLIKLRTWLNLDALNMICSSLKLICFTLLHAMHNRPSIKAGTWNIQHSTFRNIPEHPIIIIIMRKICKIKF